MIRCLSLVFFGRNPHHRVKCPLNHQRIIEDYMGKSRSITSPSDPTVPNISTSPNSPTSPNTSEKDANELLWKQYALHVDLYKVYMDMVLKIDGFYVLTVGAILSYFFSKISSDSQTITPGIIKHVLWFPILVSACL